ncbi:DUF2339 domain-containing protein [Syntrophomonas palmitatica]|uniref:DUF2339 domain-containing protein n=1 Tax=Syntrophomonas palmitatica TaxID=402877 RepID=UPI0006D00C4C|nr:DUF2339 domain-containing protein [Syntrophomonas palmitatica]
MDLDKKNLEELSAELESLKTRVAFLEEQLQSGYNRQDKVSLRSAKAGPLYIEPPEEQSSRKPFITESFIGGKLFNRIGALIVVFAAAYFLKWSFDNHIIGELGRCVLGLTAGVFLIGLGHFYFKKAYAVYAQGLTGAGIAIIYLSSYAAVNYYHLISPYGAFALMFVTALTAGVLSAVQNAPGTAIMAAVGGFLVPFLMGSHSGRIIPLLSYVLILDLGVLFLAYYRRWLVLDLLAFIGTAVITLVAFQMQWKIWAGQGFLGAFLLLFIAVAAIHNHRSRKNNLLLLLGSAIFFSMCSFANLDKHSQWYGLLSLTLAAVYLGTFKIMLIGNKGTGFFRQSLLVMAMVFSLLAAPLQLSEVYSHLAWFAVAAVLLLASDILKNKAAYIIACVITFFACFSVFTIYQNPHPLPFLNKPALLLAVGIGAWLWALRLSAKHYPGRTWLTLGIAVVCVAVLFYLLHFNIDNGIYYYQANQSFAFLIPVAWAIVSSLVLYMGVKRDNRVTRLFSLVLFGVVILRTLFYDLHQLDIVYKILVLMAVGLISLGISFYYQKRMHEEALS